MVSSGQFLIVNCRFVLSEAEFFERVNEFLRNIRLCNLFCPVIDSVVTSEKDSSPKSIVVRFSNTGKDKDWNNVLPNPFVNNKTVIFGGISLYCVWVSIYRIVLLNWVLTIDDEVDLMYCSIAFPSIQ